MSAADDYEHALGGLRGHIVYGEQTAGDTPVAWVQVKVALPYLRDAERALVAERTRAEAAEAECARLTTERDATRAEAAGLRAAIAAERAARAAWLATLLVCATAPAEVVAAEAATGAALAGEGRAEREAERGHAAVRADDASRGRHLRAAEAAVDKARHATDALLSAAPAPTTVPAALVRAYLAAEETMRLVAADDHRRDTYHEWAKRHGAAMDAVDAARTALDAALAATTTTPCRSDYDGDCRWDRCPQRLDGEPWVTGRRCPLAKET